MRTPRGAVLTIAVAIVILGGIGLGLALTAGPGTPRLEFADASGEPEQIRKRVVDSTRDGAISRSLAPGVGGEAADGLETAPIYFLAVHGTATGSDSGVLDDFAVTQLVEFVNTSDVPLAEARLHVLAPLTGSSLVDVSAGGDATGARLSGSTLTVDLGRPLEPGEEAAVELRYRLRPNRLEESQDIGDVLGSGPSTGPTAQLTRKNLVYLIDWYPRLLRLGPGGWLPGPTGLDAYDLSGPVSTVEIDIELPEGWTLAAGGVRVGGKESAGWVRERRVLAGSRALPLVAMRNAKEAEVTKGEFRVSGAALDTFGVALEDATRQAMYAKAVLSETFASTLWRETVVVGAVLRTPMQLIAADNVLLIDQDLLADAPTTAGPASQAADYRQAIFEGVSAEWWGGRVDIDASRLPAYRAGLRTWSAALVWGRLGGDPLERFSSSQELAGAYRSSREAGIPDISASLPARDYLDEKSLAIASAKAGLVNPAAAVGLWSGSPEEAAVANVGNSALSTLCSDLFGEMDERAIIAAYAQAAGVSDEEAGVVISPWLTGRDGDAEVGLQDGEGMIPLYTDASAAAADLAPGADWPVDLSSVSGAGPGWS